VLQGIGSSPWWPAEIEKRNVVVGLPITMQDDAYLSTDATSFYLKKVPILNAFTGAHEDYHRPTDTADKIDYDGAAKISRLMALVTRGLLTSDEMPEFTQVVRPENQGQRAGLRAYLGTIPDYAQGNVVGVKLSGVTKGAPADKAGVKAGDIIKNVAGKEVKNIYDYTYVLEALKIGEEVGIDVERSGKILKLKITPSSRD
jgi:C-terminal processing protease CtpA/Prc